MIEKKKDAWHLRYIRAVVGPDFASHVGRELRSRRICPGIAALCRTLGSALFALGIFKAGMVAAITISTSSAYAFGEVAAPTPLNLPFRQGRAFYPFCWPKRLPPRGWS